VKKNGSLRKVFKQKPILIKMFGKKKCKNCGEKISDSYNFCPYCRAPLRDPEGGDWGLLGKNDFVGPENVKLPLGFNTLFNSLVKNLNKQFKDFDTKSGKSPKKSGVKKGGLSISISTSGDKPPEIRVSSFGNVPEFEKQEKNIRKKSKELKLPGLDAKKFVGLPKEEPATNIRRLSNRVIYEINMPGVKSIKDISIIQLENSIEIKALSKKKVFYKIIPIKLPIRKYNLLKGKLTLELDERA
jgi:HSP20 family molecular chaperone IbpA